MKTFCKVVLFTVAGAAIMVFSIYSTISEIDNALWKAEYRRILSTQKEQPKEFRLMTEPTTFSDE